MQIVKNNLKKSLRASLKIKDISLKTKMLYPFLYLLLAVLLLSFSDPYTIKRISDLNFRYEFYTTDNLVKPQANKTYFWFKGGAIHNTQGGIAGTVLNDKFVKMYHSNQLAEQGEFENGLKVGLWTTWHPNGTIQTTQNWKKGVRNGIYYRYGLQGGLAEEGKYKKDKKHGKWIDYEKKDTIVYKRGLAVIKKSKISKAEKFKLKQESNKKDEDKKALQKSDELKNTADLAAYKDTAKANKETKKVKEKDERAKEKVLKEKEKATKKAEKEAKGDSKIKAFFKKTWGKIQPKSKPNAKSS